MTRVATLAGVAGDRRVGDPGRRIGSPEGRDSGRLHMDCSEPPIKRFFKEAIRQDHLCDQLPSTRDWPKMRRYHADRGTCPRRFHRQCNARPVRLAQRPPYPLPSAGDHDEESSSPSQGPLPRVWVTASRSAGGSEFAGRGASALAIPWPAVVAARGLGRSRARPLAERLPVRAREAALH
jgi:hypothetical protein